MRVLWKNYETNRQKYDAPSKRLTITQQIGSVLISWKRQELWKRSILIMSFGCWVSYRTVSRLLLLWNWWQMVIWRVTYDLIAPKPELNSNHRRWNVSYRCLSKLRTEWRIWLQRNSFIGIWPLVTVWLLMIWRWKLATSVWHVISMKPIIIVRVRKGCCQSAGWHQKVWRTVFSRQVVMFLVLALFCGRWQRLLRNRIR